MEYYIVNGELYSLDELQHHGIKGMKWGIRRTAEQLGHVVRTGRKKVAAKKKERDDSKAKKKAAKAEVARKKAEDEAKAKAEAEAKRPKKVSEMSDEEINAVISRMQLEKRYVDAINEYERMNAKPKEKSAGQKVFDKVVKEYGSKAMDDLGPQLLKSVGAMVINAGLKNAGVADEYKVHTNNKKK